MKNKSDWFNEKLGNIFNLQIVKKFPRHSIRFAKQHFGNKKITVVEIGTFEGENALNIFRELNVENFYIIDPYEVYNDYLKSEPHLNTKTLSKAYKEAKKRLKKYSNKIIFLRKYSDEVVNDIPSCDFIYIDGNHNYEFVKKDIENYWPKVKKGGILAGHDITGWQGVAKAFCEFVYNKKLTPHISRTDWWIVKK